MRAGSSVFPDKTLWPITLERDKQANDFYSMCQSGLPTDGASVAGLAKAEGVVHCNSVMPNPAILLTLAQAGNTGAWAQWDTEWGRGPNSASERGGAMGAKSSPHSPARFPKLTSSLPTQSKITRLQPFRRLTQSYLPQTTPSYLVAFYPASARQSPSFRRRSSRGPRANAYTRLAFAAHLSSALQSGAASNWPARGRLLAHEPSPASRFSWQMHACPLSAHAGSQADATAAKLQLPRLALRPVSHESR